MRGSVFVDSELCMGCKRCELACAVAHSTSKDLLEAIAELPRPQSRVQVDRLGEFNVPLQCRHCENAQCVAICPTGAMQRLGKDGPVIIDHELCVGCRSCVVVCHYGVPRMSDYGKALIKCDMCIERLDKDEEPACVEACPTGALVFKEIKVKPKVEKTFVQRFAQDAE